MPKPNQNQEASNTGEDEIGWKRDIWYASTVGRFMPMLIDRGPTDNTVIWREVDTFPDESSSEFVSYMEILVVPDGLVRSVLEQIHEQGKLGGVDKVLKQFLEQGLL